MLANFRKKRKISHQFLFKLGAILVLLACVFLIFTNIKIYQKRKQLNRQIEELENKIKATEQKNKDLEEGIVASENDTYIEKVAREELDLQKPGEKVFSFVRAENQQ